MPAGFNKGQIEYIKTIANVNGHKTYKQTTVSTQAHTVTSGTAAGSDSKMKYAMWSLGKVPLSLPVGSVDENTNLVTESVFTPLDVYNIELNSNQETATPSQRVTPECFLERISLKMRHITELDTTLDAQSHKEFRLIVFRHKEKQHESKQLAENFSNPLYDMLWGAGNFKYGPKGYRNTIDNQGNINYNAWSTYYGPNDRDAMMTDSVNKDDYVVMKDCRYYLGREYGGKHIYEDLFTWDHEDPIATDQNDITYVDSNKNYCWYIALFCVTNNADNAPDNLGYVRFQGNTYVTSG